MVAARSTNWLLLVCCLLKGCLAVYVDVTPREVVALPKQNVTFLCKVGVPIQYCRIEIHGMHAFNLHSDQSSSNGVVYYGDGLQAGQCGATIESVKEENNGIVKCTMGIATESRESSGTMPLTVAKAPKSPELDLSRGTDSLKVYRVGDMLQASCIVRDGRPSANITWFLDDEPIYDNLGQITIVDNAKEKLETIVQNYTRTLRATDNGKKLRCVALHPALFSHNNEISRQLDIKYAPIPPDNPIDKFGYELGKAGIITIDIFANPKPFFEWVVGDEHIKEGHVDSTGRLEAEAAKDEGRGHYVATLRIASISKQDTETQFRLTAYNDQGTSEYYVVISTSPEPEGLELGIGYIVGIVIALLLVLLVIFLLVFARATGRWCFSGGAHVIDYTQSGGETGVRSGVAPGNTDGVDNPHHQSSQEYINGRNQTVRHAGETSSDTESTVADVRHRESKFKAPKLQFTNVFKKNKDKVSHEDEIARPMELDEPKVEDAEKQQQAPPETAEGIVYAELDLVQQNVRPMVKNEDDKTEYAEIIYTQKPETDTKVMEEPKAT